MEQLIETKGLTKQYGAITAVDDLNLTIRRGEVFGLLGPNGAGKTTTTLMLLGLTEPTVGSAQIGGIDCTRNPIRVKQIVGYLPDNNTGFYGDMTGRENLRFIGRMNGLSAADTEARIDGLLARVGMAEAADRKAGTYSKGMKQRLGIADILMKDPDVLIMDEPTTGIDPEGMRELIALIRELAERDGKTILISSHQLYQIQQICDRVGIFVDGRLIAGGRIEELGAQIEQTSGYTLKLSASPDDEKLMARIAAMPSVREVTRQDGRLRVQSGEDITGTLTRSLAEGGYAVTHLRSRGGDLDEIYSRYFEKAGDMDAGDDGGKKKSAFRIRSKNG